NKLIISILLFYSIIMFNTKSVEAVVAVCAGPCATAVGQSAQIAKESISAASNIGTNISSYISAIRDSSEITKFIADKFI
ncbi:MAG: hypothetical protein QM532_03925, partial [Cyanobium sp. MAG06]|nr:hypothetical protein [Cyanobium sp. MAG06]